MARVSRVHEVAFAHEVRERLHQLGSGRCEPDEKGPQQEAMQHRAESTPCPPAGQRMAVIVRVLLNQGAARISGIRDSPASDGASGRIAQARAKLE